MFYIRADANEVVGLGHIMRCLSIAEEIKAHEKEDVTFIIADRHPEHLIHSRGFSTLLLNSHWDKMDMEIEQMIQVILSKKISLLLIDSYYVTNQYLSSLHKYIKLAYIDDLNLFAYPVDKLINYNIYAEELSYKKKYCNTETKFLLGCKYVPLREEFRGIVPVIKEEVHNILLMSGGTDNYNITNAILEHLSKCTWFLNMDFYVIIGDFNIYKKSLMNRWKDFANIHLLTNVKKMAEYMKLCDLAITAGGVTTYELLASGTPSVMYTLADNQIAIAKSVSKRGLIPWAGDMRDDTEGCLNNLILHMECLIPDMSKRKKISQCMKETVDGNGCRRLVQWLRDSIL
jgi:UDP-2,4-diacetamido-2,4,6-trideoxy-beta-L-altropyranose hydrolase